MYFQGTKFKGSNFALKFYNSKLFVLSFFARPGRLAVWVTVQVTLTWSSQGTQTVVKSMGISPCIVLTHVDVN